MCNYDMANASKIFLMICLNLILIMTKSILHKSLLQLLYTDWKWHQWSECHSLIGQDKTKQKELVSSWTEIC